MTCFNLKLAKRYFVKKWCWVRLYKSNALRLVCLYFNLRCGDNNLFWDI